MTVKNHIHKLTATALMAAVLCVLAPMSIPVGPVPLTVTTLAIYFAVYLLGGKYATAATAVYVLIGAVGVPVFSGFAGGMGKLLGPTGGYILGYIALAFLAGAVMDRTGHRGLHLAGLMLGTAACYALGTAWYCFQAGVGVRAALGLCVLPFLPGDALKIVIAMTAGPAIRRRLQKAEVL